MTSGQKKFGKAAGSYGKSMTSYNNGVTFDTHEYYVMVSPDGEHYSMCSCGWFSADGTLDEAHSQGSQHTLLHN